MNANPFSVLSNIMSTGQSGVRPSSTREVRQKHYVLVSFLVVFCNIQTLHYLNICANVSCREAVSEYSPTELKF
jgi:hypothetical protein